MVHYKGEPGPSLTVPALESRVTPATTMQVWIVTKETEVRSEAKGKTRPSTRYLGVFEGEPMARDRIKASVALTHSTMERQPTLLEDGLYILRWDNGIVAECRDVIEGVEHL